MRLVHTVAEMASTQKEVGRPLGLVPTMGALHEGHLSLGATGPPGVRHSGGEHIRQSNPVRIPRRPRHIPAGPGARPGSAGRNWSTDLALVPQYEDMYPAGFDTWVNVDRTSARLEGESRPGHFRGVSTVVSKLFNIVRPDRAYFGQKDAQQVQVIRRMNEDLNLGVELVVIPTVREDDGLAMSSRNVRLNPQERREALALVQLPQKGAGHARRWRATSYGHKRSHAAHHPSRAPWLAWTTSASPTLTRWTSWTLSRGQPWNPWPRS